MQSVSVGISIALPIELLKFEATPANKQVHLKWITLSEKNNCHFVLQRSSNGVDFRPVRKVNSKGNNSNKQFYSSHDAVPLPGLSYYRLKQVDLDGTASYSSMQSVNFTSLQAGVSWQTYPNPFTQKVTFSLAEQTIDFGANTYTLLLYNNNNQQVRTQAIHHTKFTLQRGALPKGMYFYKILSNNYTEYSGKLIIE